MGIVPLTKYVSVVVYVPIEYTEAVRLVNGHF
jgi:hypothetical protein